MNQPYQDIRDRMNELVRDVHFHYYNDEHAETHPECRTFNFDPPDDGSNKPRCCSCVVEPSWYDEHGCPRYGAHSPLLCPRVHATEVALILVSCQACAREFCVQMSWSREGDLRTVGVLRRAGVIIDLAGIEDVLVKTSLSYQIGARTLHYGDPPFHDCATGNTMNVWDLRVLEFWRWTPQDGRTGYLRLRELEIELPDATDDERAGGEQ